MTDQFDAEKWLRHQFEKYAEKELIQCADELAALKYKAEHYEYMYRELNIHANKHADNLRDELAAAKSRIDSQTAAIRALTEQNAQLIWEKNKETMDYAVAAGDNIVINELKARIAERSIELAESIRLVSLRDKTIESLRTEVAELDAISRKLYEVLKFCMNYGLKVTEADCSVEAIAEYEGRK